LSHKFMNINNLEKTIEIVEKRLVQTSVLQVIISLTVLYFLFDSILALYRTSVFEKNIISSTNIYGKIQRNEKLRSIHLDYLDNLYKSLEIYKRDSAETIWYNEYSKILKKRKDLLSLLKGRLNIFEFSIRENGKLEYNDGIGVNEFWSGIDNSKIPVKANELLENVWKINFKSFFKETNSFKIGPFAIKNDSDDLEFETALKIQNFLLSLQEIDNALEEIRKIDKSNFYNREIDDPDIQGRITGIEINISETNNKIEEINSDIAESKKKLSERINFKEKKEELRGKNFQTITFSNVSISFLTLLYLYPIIVFSSLVWLDINVRRLQYLSSNININDKYYSTWFLTYPDTYSKTFALLIFLGPMIMGFLIILYLGIFYDKVSEQLNIPINITESFVLTVIQFLGILFSFLKINKITDKILLIVKQKKIN
ncbi:coiled-coil domain-containing protein, partial [Leptospira soteropolitanensis]